MLKSTEEERGKRRIFALYLSAGKVGLFEGLGVGEAGRWMNVLYR